MQPPAGGDNWLGITGDPLPVGAAHDWAVRPGCGAVVLFSGTVRDHAIDESGAERRGVTRLTYEAYDELVVPRLRAIADEVRVRWPAVGRVALLHRVGSCEVGEPTVVVAVSAAHRPEAFAAARFAIDALKATVPIWKHEQWATGAAWGTGAHDIVDASAVAEAAN